MDYNKVKAICEKYKIKNWTLKDGLINVDGNVDLYEKELDVLPLQFGKVTGDFICSYNELISLEGAPNHVGGDFYCENNELISLEGAPNHVGGDFHCDYNYLTSLKYAPEYIGGEIDCTYNNICDIYSHDGVFTIGCNPVNTIYQYLIKDRRIAVSIEYFKDCKILSDKDIYIERFKAFLDSYGLNSNINVDELEMAGYTIK